MTKIEFLDPRYDDDADFLSVDIIIDGKEYGRTGVYIEGDCWIITRNLGWNLHEDFDDLGIPDCLWDDVREELLKFARKYYDDYLADEVTTLCKFRLNDHGVPAVAELIHRRGDDTWVVIVYVSDPYAADYLYWDELGPFSSEEEAIAAFNRKYDQGG